MLIIAERQTFPPSSASALLSYASLPSKLLVRFTGICYHRVPGLHPSTQLAPAALCQRGPVTFKACQVLVLEAKARSDEALLHPCASPWHVAVGVPDIAHREAMAQGDTTCPHHSWCRRGREKKINGESCASGFRAASPPPFSAPLVTVSGDVQKRCNLFYS